MTDARLTRRTLLGATESLCQRDLHLSQVVENHGPPPLWARRPGYATLVKMILEQQVSLASAASTYKRVQAAAGPITPETILELGKTGLQRAGVTRQKSEYCRNLAALIVAGEVDLRKIGSLNNDAVRKSLVNIKGIGPWTAEVYLLMALRRPDIWPTGDLALAKAMQDVMRLRTTPTAERQRQIAKQWAPWRSVAARILWHHYLSKS